MHQHQKQRAEQGFVGHRIEILAQIAALLKHARQCAIQRIGQAGHHKQRKAENVIAIKNGRHQERGETEAQQREQVWNGAEWIQSRGRNISHSRFLQAANPHLDRPAGSNTDQAGERGHWIGPNGANLAGKGQVPDSSIWFVNKGTA